MTEKSRISKVNQDIICSKLEWEGGFEYLITGSDFHHVSDPAFHKLRKAFVKAYKALDAYLEYDKYLDSLGGE